MFQLFTSSTSRRVEVESSGGTVAQSNSSGIKVASKSPLPLSEDMFENIKYF
jgi:hypothetical protein